MKNWIMNNIEFRYKIILDKVFSRFRINFIRMFKKFILTNVTIGTNNHEILSRLETKYLLVCCTFYFQNTEKLNTFYTYMYWVHTFCCIGEIQSLSLYMNFNGRLKYYWDRNDFYDFTILHFHLHFLLLMQQKLKWLGELKVKFVTKIF